MAVDRDGYIFRKGVTPNTLSVISSKNRVFSTNAQGMKVQLGVVATFDPSEARTIEPVRGIGFGDHIAELVPGVTDPMSISITRTALYLSNIYQVFGYKSGVDGVVRSLRQHRWPFDIQQELVFSQLAVTKLGNSQSGTVDTVLAPTEGATTTERAVDEYVQGLVTIYEACWISDYSVSFASDTALVQESVTVNVSDILTGDGYVTGYTENDFSANGMIEGTQQEGLSIRLSQPTA